MFEPGELGQREPCLGGGGSADVNPQVIHRRSQRVGAVLLREMTVGDGDHSGNTTASREDASTIEVLTSYPAFPRTSAAASAFCWRKSASRMCLPTPTRRAIACPI